MSPTRSASVERAVFERAVREHHDAVYRTALRILRDEALALDVVQQVFLRLLEGKLGLAGAVDPQRLLRCAAAREALMVLRAASNRRRREEQHAMERHESYDDPLGEVADTLQAVRRALAQLPDDLRTALNLRFQEGLTFAELGGVLSISEPSAHQRVQRGLEKLKERLTRLGVAAAAPDLTGLLARDGQCASAPPGLESKLLALQLTGKASLGGAVATTLLAGALAIAAGVGAWKLGMFQGAAAATAPSPAFASATPGFAAGGSAKEDSAASYASELRRAVADASAARQDGPGAPAAPLEDGVVEGLVVDEFGLPLEGVSVRAASIERDGKFAAHASEATTSRGGAFRFSLPVSLAKGQDYEVRATTPSFVSPALLLRVRPGRACAPQRIQLAREDVDRPGAWRLWLTLQDEAGRVVPGAIARVHWIVRNEAGAWWSEQQASGKSEADGAVTLQGEGLGRRLLSIDARAAGFAPYSERIEIEHEGDARRSIVLRPGVALEGTIVDEHGAPLAVERIGAWRTALYATSFDRNTWYAAEFPEPGRFRIPALHAEPHRLHFVHDRWSSFSLEDVVPGQAQVALVLKRKADSRDIGTHRGEIHGELVDAGSGAAVSASGLVTWLEPIPFDSPALADGDWTSLLMQQVVAQTSAGFSSGEDQPQLPPPNVFVYDNLSAGRYAVRVRAAGYAPTLVGPLELDENQIASGLTVRLERGATVRGVVRGPDGAPLAGARVVALGDGALSQELLRELDAELRATGGRGHPRFTGAGTDALGRFTLEHLPTDCALRLYALHPDHDMARAAALELAEGRAESVELRAGPRRER